MINKYHNLLLRLIAKSRVFQLFLSRGTFETVLSIWQSPDTQNIANLRMLREPSKELVEPLGSAEPRLKNTGLESCDRKIWISLMGVLQV